jgi:hypothetical protein
VRAGDAHRDDGGNSRPLPRFEKLVSLTSLMPLTCLTSMQNTKVSATLNDMQAR